MTDQDTLNKIFDAALKEPEKPEPKPKRSTAPMGTASGAGAANRGMATTGNNSTASSFQKPAAQQKIETKAQDVPKPEPEKKPVTETAKKEEVVDDVIANPMSMTYMCVFLMISISVIAFAFWFFFLR